MDEYIGTISLFAGNFAPKNWALCNGQILYIQQNNALFAILGITYGGDGKTTFALPDLRGRVPIGVGQGTGLTNRELGKVGGEEAVTLTTAQIPSHTHTHV
jgi:microcystin-dependent protein